MQKNVLFILMPDNYRDEEFYEPYNILKKNDFMIDVAGFKQGIATGSKGYKYMPNLLINKLNDTELKTYDAIVIPGGKASTKYLWYNEFLKKLINYFYNNKKIVAAICYAVIPLVQAGILNGKIATVYPTEEAKNIFKENNVTFSQNGCVVLEEERIITAQGPSFSKEFGHEIVKMLNKI